MREKVLHRAYSGESPCALGRGQDIPVARVKWEGQSGQGRVGMGLYKTQSRK